MVWEAVDDLTAMSDASGTASDTIGETRGDTHSLVVQAMPVIVAVIQTRLRFTHASWWNNEQQRSDAEDLENDALLQLLVKFERLRTYANEAPIHDLPSYAASVAHQVCNQYLRQKYPQRTRLSDQLRYVFTHQPGVKLWTNDAQVRLCGFQVWQTQGRLAVATEKVRRLCESSQELSPVLFPARDWQRLHLADLCAQVFQHFDAPLEFADLVTLLVRLRGINDSISALALGGVVDGFGRSRSRLAFLVAAR